MRLPNTADQAGPHREYGLDGTTTGGASQLVLPVQASRSFLLFMNLSDTDMYLEIGPARATCALTSGVVTSVTITNGGFNYTVPPVVEFLGGVGGVASTYAGAGAANLSIAPGSPGFAGHPAQALATLSSGAVNAVNIDDGGSGYTFPPYVLLRNLGMDPFGCADAFYGSAVSGRLVSSGGGSYYVNGTTCPTDSVAVYCSAASKRFTVRWMA